MVQPRRSYRTSVSPPLGVTRPWMARAAFVSCFAGLSVHLAACRERATTEAGIREPGVIDIEVTTPTLVELPRHVRVTGTLFGAEESTIAAKVAGRIVRIHADMGDRVAHEAPLLSIDPKDYELGLAERRRAYAETLSRVGLDSLPEGDFNVDAVPAVSRAMHEWDNSKSRLERARKLADRKPPLISEQDFQDLETASEVARSNVDVERLNVRSILAEASTLLAQVEIAAQRLADATPRAPALLSPDEGGDAQPYEIAQRFVSVGDFVQVGDALVRLVDADPIKLRLNIPERRSAFIRAEQPAMIRVDSVEGVFAGTVSRISPTVNVDTRTLPIEIEIPNPDRRLKPGSFATAEIEVGREPTLVVPRSAVLTFAGVNKVVVIEENIAKERAVQIGAVAEASIEITEGLQQFETIALRPNASLTTGTRVRIVPASADTGSASDPSSPAEGGS